MPLSSKLDNSMVPSVHQTRNVHGGRRSIRSVARSIDRVDRFDRFALIFDFLETSGSSRSVRCQSFSSVRRLEAEKTSKNQNEKIWIFGQVRFGRFDNPFDSIDNVPMGDGGPPWLRAAKNLRTRVKAWRIT